ncbi:MAG: hypothetical protein GWN01_10415 [Nitrosopumilaceae archaeon]|nr:hypothetical protein [Nitrosopumilaceae archaeon]NIX61914.1 hypothetical protein [Nitrosopumilaceae archaeon]
MLDEIGEEKASQAIISSIQDVLEDGVVKTIDLGGVNTCSDMGDAVASKLK